MQTTKEVAIANAGKAAKIKGQEIYVVHVDLHKEDGFSITNAAGLLQAKLKPESSRIVHVAKPPTATTPVSTVTSKPVSKATSPTTEKPELSTTISEPDTSSSPVTGPSDTNATVPATEPNINEKVKAAAETSKVSASAKTKPKPIPAPELPKNDDIMVGITRDDYDFMVKTLGLSTIGRVMTTLRNIYDTYENKTPGKGKSTIQQFSQKSY